MENTIQTNVINYVDANGKLVFNATVQTVQVRNEADLAQLTGMGTGTRAYLPDESKMWVLGADGQWSQKANGGGGGSDLLIVNITQNDDETISVDKTIDEIHAAVEAGKTVLGVWYMATGTFFEDGFEFLTYGTDILWYTHIMYDDVANEWQSETYGYSLTPVS